MLVRCLVLLLVAAVVGPRQLDPIPDHGAVPPIVAPAAEPAPDEAAVREFARAIRRIRREHLGDVRDAALRAEGINQLRELTDPAAFGPLVDELAGERGDVRLAVLDHLAVQGDLGQAALARVAVNDPDEAMRYEAMRRMVAPASDAVLREIEAGLRSPVHEIANHAGTLAGSLRALETIPLLIFAQATADPVGDDGDVAWIAIETQRAFVAAVEPVVGSGAGAFQPIPGIVTEGAILRVVDAVAIFYRTEVHRVLVVMTTDDWGQSTAALGYDIRRWWEWYNAEYVPFRNQPSAGSP